MRHAGFMKDGPENHLRVQDIQQIVGVFTKRLEIPKYPLMVSLAEIEKRESNSSTSICRVTS
jgi:type I restriction enzyme M protein